MEPFKVLTTERLLNERYCTVDKERVVFPDGTEGDWFIKQNCNAVIIVPILKTGEVLLERTYKHGCGEVIIEFPAGLIDEGEAPEEAAKRELLEETGYTSPKWTLLGEAYASPTGSPMKHVFYLAEECEQTHETELESAEQIELVLQPDIATAKKFIKESISSNTAYAALQMHYQYEKVNS